MELEVIRGLKLEEISADCCEKVWEPDRVC